jgi:hypothetical protein
MALLWLMHTFHLVRVAVHVSDAACILYQMPLSAFVAASHFCIIGCYGVGLYRLQIGKAAAVSGAVYGLFRLVKTITPLPVSASTVQTPPPLALSAQSILPWFVCSSCSHAEAMHAERALASVSNALQAA